MKNPFIFDIDYGEYFTDAKKLSEIVSMHRNLFRAVADYNKGDDELTTNIMKFIMQIGSELHEEKN